jgi:ketosteroid isomerase-like protein
MSQENLEAFNRAFEAGSRFNADAVLEELHPDVEWHAMLPMLGGDAVYRGHEGVRAWLRDLEETFAETHLEFPEIRDLGDRIVAIGRLRARGRVAPRPRCLSPTWSSSRMARGSGFGPTSIPKKPSKPPGCGSRRCRGR